MAKVFIFGESAPVGRFWEGAPPPKFKGWGKGDGENNLLTVDDDLESSGGGVFVVDQAGERHCMTDVFLIREGEIEVFRYVGYDDDNREGKPWWRSTVNFDKLIQLD